MNRPKLEFVPKTLADLHIEGIHELNHGRRYGSSQSLSRPPLSRNLPPSSSVGDLSTVDPLKAWDSPAKNRTGFESSKPGWSNDVLRPNSNTRGFKPHPAPRNQFNGLRDPWTGDFVLFCWVLGCTAFGDGVLRA